MFWQDSVSLADDTHFHSERIPRPAHITVVYLAALALREDAKMVTFGTSIPWQAAVGGTRGLIEVPRV